MAPFTITYQKGRRHVFAALKRQGAMHSSSKPLKDKGKQQLKKEEDNHEEEREFELIHIDSDEENETRIVKSLLQDRNAYIKDLEAGLERSKDLIHFLKV